MVQTKITDLIDQDYVALLQPLWAYLGVFDSPTPSDVLFVFGGLDLAVPRRTSELYAAGYAPTILISGATGPYSRGVFKTTEAEAFRDEMLKHGTPESAILLEKQATNTLQNVVNGMATLAERGLSPSNAILVGKTFLMRRCRATFGKQQPDVSIRCCPPLISIIEAIDRDRADFAGRLLAELRRLDEYGRKGDILREMPPPEVSEAAAHLSGILGV